MEKHPLIRRDEEGRPRIVGAGNKVALLIRHLRVYEETPEEAAEALSLSLEQVQAAISFYEDHKEEIEADLRRRWEEAEQLEREWRESEDGRRFAAWARQHLSRDEGE